jgi:LacI family transcriptional regulator
VVIAVPTAATWGQQIVRGATAYARRQGPRWELLYEAGDSQDVGRIEHFPQACGALVHAWDGPLAEAARRFGGPVVSIESRVEGLDAPYVGADDVAVGRLAYRHLSERGFHHLGYWGPIGSSFSQARLEGFRSLAARDGRRVSVLEGTGESGELGTWLSALSRPAGVFAADCNFAAKLAWQCREIGIHLPSELAILGVDNDELLCEITTPRLSSIDQGCRHVGYRAAELLDGLLDGRSPPAEPVLVPPVGVVQRESTDTVAVDHPDVARAVQFIRARALSGIGVSDVLEHVAAARRTLEVHFRRCLGRTVHAEITRVRIEHARYLLRATDAKARQIARQCGFGSASYFATAFARSTGQSPSEYRAGQGGPSGPGIAGA